MVSHDAPEWVRIHAAYYRRFNEDQYRMWSTILTKERGGTHDMMLEAVNEMIRSGFSGYLEDHLKWFQAWVSARSVDGACPDCGNMGLVKVPNRGRLLGDWIYVLCHCPKRLPAMSRYPNAATIEQYERKYGKRWREPAQSEIRFPQQANISDVYSARNSVGVAL